MPGALTAVTRDVLAAGSARRATGAGRAMKDGSMRDTGVLVGDKDAPASTSFDVVRCARAVVWASSRVGHAGTLDPDADGRAARS